MPLSKESRALIEAQSPVAKYVHRFTEGKLEKEKRRYEKEEPLAKSKSWDEFLWLAISSQVLEGRSADAIAVIRNEENHLLSKTKLKPNSYMGFGERQNPDLDQAIENLDRRARRHFEESRSGHRHSHHYRGGGDVSQRRGKFGGIIVVWSHPMNRYEADEEHAESHRGSQPSQTAQSIRRSHMSSIYEEEIRPTPLRGSNHGPAPPREYVIPPRPPIIIALQNPSSGSLPHSHPPSHRQSSRGSTVDNLRGSTIIGSGYSSRLPEIHYPGAHPDQGVHDTTARGGSRARSEARRSGTGSGNNLDLPNWGFGGGENRNRTSGAGSGTRR